MSKPEQLLEKIEQLTPEERSALADRLITEQLTQEERDNLTGRLLTATQPNERGFLPYPVFVAGAGKFTLSTLEIAPLRHNPDTGRPEVLLLERPASDEWWAHKWHIPGTAVRANDEVTPDEDIDFDDPNFDPVASYRAPIKRLTREELKGGVILSDGPHLFDARFRRGIRGPESTVMLYAGVEVADPSKPLPVGQFFDVEEVAANPPGEGLVVGHRYAIARAAAAFAIAQASQY